MAGKISRFYINGLYGSRNINVSIDNNKIVLVGENGTGKSTVANFIYFFLTHQWSRLLEYDFKSIIAVIDNNEINLSIDEISSLRRQRHDRRLFNTSRYRELEYILSRELRDSPDITQEKLEQLSRRYHIPIHNIYEIARHSILPSELPLIDSSKHIEEVDKLLNKLIKYQVLYLPTYRRIERDLRSIFRGKEAQFHEFPELQSRMIAHEGYIEFIEFGMEDVEKAINNKMEEIKENVRTGLSKLTGTYLRDVILEAYKSTDLLPSIIGLGESTINAIFARIPTEILPKKEQNKLRKIIKDINKRQSIAEKDQVIAHFLSQLIGLHKEQSRQEGNVDKFVDVCNQYLKPSKEIIYDNIAFEIYVQKTNIKKKSQKIALKDLSSGEKQIVSLFCHIYLSGTKGYFVIIDEPELSLSVPWQRRFLPDILNTGICEGLVAATHSPFIYDNVLEPNTHSLEEFIRS